MTLRDHPDYPWHSAMGPFDSEADAQRATLADANRRCRAANTDRSAQQPRNPWDVITDRVARRIEADNA